MMSVRDIDVCKGAVLFRMQCGAMHRSVLMLHVLQHSCMVFSAAIRLHGSHASKLLFAYETCRQPEDVTTSPGTLYTK